MALPRMNPKELFLVSVNTFNKNMRILIVVSFIALFISCNQKQEVGKDIKEVARELMIASKNCALITVDSLRIAHARTMDPFLPESDFTVWFGTNPKSRKVQDIRRNPNVTLYYFDKDDPGYVTIQGKATLVDDSAKKEQFWKEEWQNFYKDRKVDYVLIKVVPTKLYVISERYQLLGDSITWKAPEVQFISN